MQRIADAIRKVTSQMQRAIDDGHRSRMIDADDLAEALLAIADELDPEFADRVGADMACPECGEDRVDRLVWNGDEVRCQRCGKAYAPPVAPRSP
jgi:DNA-directed RNA polymerase subunit RPC12/RpoP